MMPCEPWQSPQAGASLEPSPMTRFPWNDWSYILNSEAWQSLQAVSLACSYQPSVSSAVCSRASKPGVAGGAVHARVDRAVPVVLV